MERTARKAEGAGTTTKLFTIMKKRGRSRLTSGVWEAALGEEDKLAHQLIDEAVEALGAGVASVQNLVDVDAMVVGGGLGTRLGQPFVLTERCDNGGALGAALLASA